MSTVVDNRSFEEVFPQVDPGVRPLGDRVLVQLRFVRTKSSGGIMIVDETKKDEKYNEVVALVRELGPLAYRHVETLAIYPEGLWCVPGDIVRTIKWNGDRFSVPYEDDFVHFVMVADREIIAKVADFEAAKRMKAFI